MSQDTRKDKRAKVVSLNVRYKSATVDEFIENHSHDVSKGGIFVKTPTPFPPGTLLKFEIRLAGDKSVISGVGRVVWKREPSSAGPEKPAGMGVKFIKIDDASRTIIERLTKQEGAGSAYTSDPAAAADEEGSGKPSTLRGIPAAAPHEPPADAPAPATPAVPAVAAKPAVGTAGAISKPPAGAAIGAKPATMMGVGPGAISIPKPGGAAAPKSDAKPEAKAVPTPGPKKVDTKPGMAAANVPKPTPQMPPARKATMMGMGIADALKAEKEKAEKKKSEEAPDDDAWDAPEGGGALGPNDKPTEPEVPAATPAPAAAAGPMFPNFEVPDSGSHVSNEPTVMKQAAELLEEALKEAGGSLDEIGQNPLFVQKGSGKVDKEPVSVPNANAPTSQSGDTVIMGTPVGNPAAAAARAGSSPAIGETPAPAPAIGGSQPPPPVSAVPPPPSSAQPRTPVGVPGEKKGGAGLIIGLLLVVLVIAAGGVYAFQSGKLASLGIGAKAPGEGDTTPPPPSATPSASVSASASAPASASASAPASASAVPVAMDTDASTNAAMDAGPTKDASAAATTTTTTTAEPPPKPTAAPKPTAEAPPKPTAAPPPPPKPTAAPKPKPSATATDTGEAPAPPPPPPAPTPTKSVDDPF